MIPIGEDTFLRRDGKGAVTFTSQYAYTNVSHCTFEKISKLEEKKLLLGAILSVILILIVSSVIVLIKLLRHKYTKGKRYNEILCISNLLGVISMIGAVFLTIAMITSYQYGAIGLLQLLLWGILVSDLGMILSIVTGVYWRVKCKTVWWKNTAFGIVCFAQIIFILITPRLFI